LSEWQGYGNYSIFINRLIKGIIMFNIEDFDIKLNTDFIGRNFIYTDEVDSTNSTLLNTKEFRKNGTVLLSEFQKKGRGRKDRYWVSTSGQNLTFSILLLSNLTNKSINLLNLGSSLALAQTLENLFQIHVKLKWPNDVLINNKKISGILLESTSKGNKIEKIVIGVGINVNQASFQGEFNLPPTSVRLEFKHEVSRERILSEYLNNFEPIFAASSKNSGKILNDWKSRCDMIGKSISIIENNQKKFGVFEDIDEQGYLLLQKNNKIEKISFGDVSLVN